MSASDFEKFMKNKVEVDVRTGGKLPPEYHDMFMAFSREVANALPPRRPGFELKIELQPDAKVPFMKYLLYHPASAIMNNLASDIGRSWQRP